MPPFLRQLRARITNVAALPNAALFFVLFGLVVLSHATLLRLPYFWDEGGYYIPAALDFFHRGTLIPQYTNAHPPLPNVVLGSLWHVFGYQALSTRLIVCAFAAASLLAVFRLSVALTNAEAAIATTLLTAIYPIWFAQSTLAHADIFAATFTLWAFALYLPAQAMSERATPARTKVAIAVLFSLAALSKETAIIEPVALAGFHLYAAWRKHRSPDTMRLNLRWFALLALPLLPLILWYGYHRFATGFTFGNPEYLRYNATANFTASHIFMALQYRFIHLVWQRNMWVPILLAAVCLLPFGERSRRNPGLPERVVPNMVVLLGANWVAFSVLGGALLTRYLLPMYPLILLGCVVIWGSAWKRWPVLAVLTWMAFFSGLWWSSPTAYAPEDCLTYRDMIVVHQQAIAFIDEHFPEAHVLTSWPAAAELSRPELGYTDHPIFGPQIDNFTAASIAQAAQKQDEFDTALVFNKNFVPPSLEKYLAAHPTTKRSLEFAAYRDLNPQQIAALLGGEVVFSAERGGEWASVLRFPRRYESSVHSFGVPLEALTLRAASDSGVH